MHYKTGDDMIHLNERAKHLEFFMIRQGHSLKNVKKMKVGKRESRNDTL